MKPLEKNPSIEGSDRLQEIVKIARGKERSFDLLESMKLIAEDLPEDERLIAQGLIESFIVSWE